MIAIIDYGVGNLFSLKSSFGAIGADVIVTDDEDMDAFLFSLGCYSGEPITVVSHLRGGCVVSIKDGRYTIDKQLAAAIRV